MVQSSSYFTNLYDLAFSPYALESATWQQNTDMEEVVLKEDAQCLICIADIADKDKLVRLDCNPLSKEDRFHHYHYDCFVAIPNKNDMGCPKCKVGIYPPTIAVCMKKIVASSEQDSKRDTVLYLHASRFAPLKPSIIEFLQSRSNRISSSMINAAHWVSHWITVVILVISCTSNLVRPFPRPQFTPRQIWNGTLPLQQERPICAYKPVNSKEDKEVQEKNKTLCSMLHDPLRLQGIVERRRESGDSIDAGEFFKIGSDNIIRLHPSAEAFAKNDRTNGIIWD